MRTQILILTLLLITTTALAQNVSKQVIGSTGMAINNNSHTINFTVGESVVGVMQNTITINQGFWDAFLNNETLSVASSPLINGITYYPNPVVNDLIINFNNEISSDFDVVLYDVSGRRIFGKTLNSYVKRHKINMSSFSKGTYIMQLSSKTNSYNKSIKILKK